MEFGATDVPIPMAGFITGPQVLALLNSVIPRVLAANTWLRPGTVTGTDPLTVDVEGAVVTPDNPLAVSVTADEPVWVLCCPDGAVLLGGRTVQ